MSIEFLLKNILLGLLACQIVTLIAIFLAYRTNYYLYLIGFTLYSYIQFMQPELAYSWTYTIPLFYAAAICLSTRNLDGARQMAKVPKSASKAAIILGCLTLLLWFLKLENLIMILADSAILVYAGYPFVYFIRNFKRFNPKEKFVWFVLWSVILSGMVLKFSHSYYASNDFLLMLGITLTSSLIFVLIFQILSIYKFSVSTIEEKNTSLIQNNLSLNKSNLLLEEKLLAAQDQAFNNQINPHFIFNAINSIVSLIYAQKNTEAKSYLNDFSELLNRIFSHKNSSFISLEEELLILEKYVSLEKLRKKSPFNFKIELDKDVKPDQVFVPRLFFQALIENSIWHGLSEEHELQDSEIKLSIRKSENSILAEVTDNGIGMSIAMQKKPDNFNKSSKGITIIKERLSILEQHFQIKTFFEMKDVSDSTGIHGTKTTLKLPLISVKPQFRNARLTEV